MSTTESYPTTPNVAEFLSEEQYRVYDTFLAATLSICTLVGLPGNIASLIYFYSSKRKDFSSFIYILVCSIDICTCVIHIPVMMALYTNRKPGLFDMTMFCVGWSVTFYFLQLISMFLVMLMSVSRSIKLVMLRYEVQEKYLIVSFLLYSGFIVARFILILLWREESTDVFFYGETTAYCYYDISLKPLSYIDQFIHVISVGAPPTITTLSFAVFMIKLFRKTSVSRMNQKKYRAAVTMAMFSTLFLICNLPCLLNNILWFLTELMHKYPEPFYVGDFMFFYSWLISDVICTVVNASLNPVLYFSRMVGFRNWVKSKFRASTPSSRDNTLVSFRLSAINVIDG